jgi:hypothetical protein
MPLKYFKENFYEEDYRIGFRVMRNFSFSWLCLQTPGLKGNAFQRSKRQEERACGRAGWHR